MFKQRYKLSDFVCCSITYIVDIVLITFYYRCHVCSYEFVIRFNFASNYLLFLANKSL